MGHRKELKTYFYTRDIAQNEARRRDMAEIRPRYGRDIAEMEPRYGGDTVEIRRRCGRDIAEIRRRYGGGMTEIYISPSYVHAPS